MHVQACCVVGPQARRLCGKFPGPIGLRIRWRYSEGSRGHHACFVYVGQLQPGVHMVDIMHAGAVAMRYVANIRQIAAAARAADCFLRRILPRR
jgi:hypothetical protein